MKHLHRPDLRCWSAFDESRDIDFNSVAWIRAGGNVLVDPMPMGEHDLAQLTELGGAAHIVITNSDHLRDGIALAERFGAELVAPQAEREVFPAAVTRFVGDGDEVDEGLGVFELDGSKTPGELSLLLDHDTLITSDLVRAQRPGQLNLLPDEKLSDRAAAVRSVARLAQLPGLSAVLVGDGWSLFDRCSQALASLT